MKWSQDNQNQMGPEQVPAPSPSLNETIAPEIVTLGPYPRFAVKTTNVNPAVQAKLDILLINLRLLQERATSVFPMQLKGIDRTDIDTLVAQAEEVQAALKG